MNLDAVTEGSIPQENLDHYISGFELLSDPNVSFVGVTVEDNNPDVEPRVMIVAMRISADRTTYDSFPVGVMFTKAEYDNYVSKEVNPSGTNADRE